MNYIASTTEEFFKKLGKLEKDLEGFSQELSGRSDRIPQLLEDFKGSVQSIERKISSSGSGENAVDAALKKTLKNMEDGVAAWGTQVEANRKGTEFMKKHEKYLVVMIFGAVKAGKSSLGNFFAGKELRQASFDNIYKSLSHPVFETEERGRDTGDIEQDAEGKTWFKEGVTDTTGAIQFFTLSGLRWFDSPGTGALQMEGDRVHVEDMVNEYLPYTDLCMFLMNSSEPGLQDDMRYMEKLSREGQEAIVVITKSDAIEADVDDNGELINTLNAKPEDTRKLQENNICERVKEAYPGIDANKYRAISISTALAKEAVRKESEDLFRQSNIDKLMKILGDKVSDDAIERKARGPRQALNGFLNRILDGEGEGERRTPGIVDFEKDLPHMESCVAEYRKGIEKRAENVARKARQEVRLAVRKLAGEWNAQVRGGGAISGENASQSISEILQETVGRLINEEMSRIIEDYHAQSIPTAQMAIRSSGLKKEQKTIEHESTEYFEATRPPRGLVEKVFGFFGRKYYEMQSRTKTHTEVIDLGTNLDSFLDEILPQAESYASVEAKKSLEYLAENYFRPQERFAQNMKEELRKLRNEIEKLKL